MQTDSHSKSQTPAEFFRSFLSADEPTHALIQMAIAHELAYIGPDNGPALTLGARERLLNIHFTHGLRSIAKRRDGNPFTAAESPAPEAVMRTLYKQLVSDQPNAIQELFTLHLDDLRAYLRASSLPRATFLFVCALFVIDAQHVRPS